jgi:hypothetical protein
MRQAAVSLLGALVMMMRMKQMFSAAVVDFLRAALDFWHGAVEIRDLNQPVPRFAGVK